MKEIRITVQGKGWYGQLAQMDYTIRRVVYEPDSSCAGDLYVAKGQTMKEALEDWLSLNTGDFMSIDAWEAREVTTTIQVEELASENAEEILCLDYDG